MWHLPPLTRGYVRKTKGIKFHQQHTLLLYHTGNGRKPSPSGEDVSMHHDAMTPQPFGQPPLKEGGDRIATEESAHGIIKTP